MILNEILQLNGDFGRAQWYLLSIFSAVNIFSAFHYFAQTFIMLNPKQRCDEIRFNFTNVMNVSKVDEQENENLKWLTWGFKSLTGELDWICDDEWKSALVQSMFFIGSVTGTLILGSLADLFGRIPMFITANLLAVLGNFLTIYLIPNVWCLSVARFVAGLATDTNFFMMFIIVMEYMKPSVRTFGLNFCIGLWYCIGCMLLPWLAVLTMNWRIFLLNISIPTLLIPLSCFIIPESAQWLLSVGRPDDALACYKKLAKINGEKISNDFIERFQRAANNDKFLVEKASLWGLFKTPRLRRKSCILLFKTIVLNLSYDAISRNIEGLGLDPFLVFTITSASILPACLVILLVQDKIGRKILAVFFLLLTGLFNFFQGILLVYNKNAAFAVALVGLFGRFSVNVAYNSGTQYAAELIPTQVRARGLAFMHAVGYAATFFSPQILYLSTFWAATPQMILGFISLLGAIFCLFLPETRNKVLPSSLQDGEVFGESEKPLDFLKFNANSK